MRRCYLVLVIAALLGLSAALRFAPTHARATDDSPTRPTGIALLQTATPEQVGAAYWQAMGERSTVVEALLSIIRQAPEGGTEPRVVDAMKLIGSYRAPECVDVLLDRIELDQVRPTSRPYGDAMDDPTVAARTLAEIGNPVIDKALERLPRENKRRRILSLSFVMKEVLGKPCALLRLEEARANAAKAGSPTTSYDMAIEAVSQRYPWEKEK